MYNFTIYLLLRVTCNTYNESFIVKRLFALRSRDFLSDDVTATFFIFFFFFLLKYYKPTLKTFYEIIKIIFK